MKLTQEIINGIGQQDAPCAGARIETILEGMKIPCHLDAPCAGARIETILEGMKIPCHLDAPCAGARIETSKSTKNLTGANKMPPVWSLVEDFW